MTAQTGRRKVKPHALFGRNKEVAVIRQPHNTIAHEPSVGSDGIQEVSIPNVTSSSL